MPPTRVSVEYGEGLVNVANAREPVRERIARVRRQRRDAWLRLSSQSRTPPAVPVRVALTRLSPRPFNRHDGLPIAFKPLADGVCDWLGVPDEDPRIEFTYHWQQTPNGTPERVRIEVTTVIEPETHATPDALTARVADYNDVERAIVMVATRIVFPRPGPTTGAPDIEVTTPAERPDLARVTIVWKWLVRFGEGPTALAAATALLRRLAVMLATQAAADRAALAEATAILGAPVDPRAEKPL